MFLIFSHLIRNALTSLKRLLLEPKNIGIASGLAALVVVASGLWTHSAAIRNASQQDNQSSVTKTQELQSDHAQKSAHAQTDASGATTQSDGTASPQSKSSSSDGSSKSSDAAAASQQSFSTVITHAGQVSAGTLIAYNANKNEKTYYGGDLALSATALTISKSNSTAESRIVTISSPDGQTLNTPTSPWDDKSPYFWITADSSNAKSSGTSFDMLVDFSSNVPTGTYQLHLTSGRAQQPADNWRYDNFITITVTD